MTKKVKSSVAALACHVLNRATIGTYLLVIVLLFIGTPVYSDTASAILPKDCRIQEMGAVQADGGYSFWHTEHYAGLLGDYVLVEEDGDVTFAVTATAQEQEGTGPLVRLTLTSPESGERVEVFPMKNGKHTYAKTLRLPKGFYTFVLRHTNRPTANSGRVRNLKVFDVTVTGAVPAPTSEVAYTLFSGAAGDGDEGPREVFSNDRITLFVSPQSGRWSVCGPQGGVQLADVRPVVSICGLPVSLREYTLEQRRISQSDPRFGKVTGLELNYSKQGALRVTYTILLAEDEPELYVKLGFENLTKDALTVLRASPLAVASLTLPGEGWMFAGDAHNCLTPYSLHEVQEGLEADGWWYGALRSRAAGCSLVSGGLENNKGLSRNYIHRGASGVTRYASYQDYEKILMPAGAQIEGEWTFLHLGQTGLDGLMRLGTMIAKVHDIDLARDCPLDPYDPNRLQSFNSLINWGAAVIEQFPYRKHDVAKYRLPCYDPAWEQANTEKFLSLGFRDYGYNVPRKGYSGTGGVTPFARNYGGDHERWGKGSLKDEHPEWYREGRIDFSNPEVIAFERDRVATAFAEKRTSTVSYHWDFTAHWRKLEDQHDPFRTSAETYRTAMGIWADAARRHPKGAESTLMVNVVGINYGLVEKLRFGGDSDHGYRAKSCSFMMNNLRQASGRWWLNGRVWWNNPDSFHVYAGGLRTYNQAKVHATMCSMGGNLAWVGEPFVEYGEDMPEERLDIIRRVAPVTSDTGIAVDMFERNPARLWNMPVNRKFGSWNVAALFNFDFDNRGEAVTQEIAMADLGLDPEKEYLVYEFWRKQFLGTVRKSFTRTLPEVDCEVYSLVEKKEHPLLVSTSRHLRQMAYDVMDLKWDGQARTLAGTSKVVGGDSYELRVYVPAEYRLVEASAPGLEVESHQDGELCGVSWKSPENRDVSWVLQFAKGLVGKDCLEASPAASTAPVGDALPNIVLVFTDDQGYADLGCFGGRGFQTPHLDRMAAEGTKFTSFYVAQAVCTASRAALMTGCYANRVSMSGALNHTSRIGIHPDEILLPEICKSQGYATAIFGKWHLGTLLEFGPLRNGFDEYLGIPYSNDNSKYHPILRDLPPLPLYDGEQVVEVDPDQSQFTRRFTERAVRFIEANGNRPFFLYVPHVMPHVPIFASEKFLGRTARGLYGDVIEELDWSVGEILAALRKCGLDDKTMVVFASDNGPFLSYGDHAGSASPFREGKLTTFEGGVRTPCIIRWPGRVPAGRVCDELILSIDLLPTIAALVGADPPPSRIDGQDVWPVISGQEGATTPHEAFYYYAGRELQAVRSGRWKLHFPHQYLTVAGAPGRDGKPANFENLQPEAIEQSGIHGIASRHGYRVSQIGLTLYDLQADPGETRNLAEEHPHIVARLAKLAEAARADLGDTLTGQKGTGIRPAASQ